MQKKPVMVWFHGGGYTNGSSIEGVAYDGKNLSEYGDVVVVTVNHRLNVLAATWMFLNTVRIISIPVTAVLRYDCILTVGKKKHC